VQESAISYASLTARGLVPNRWDIIAFPLVFGLLLLAAKGAHQTLEPLSALKEPVVSLDPVNLPEYALRTTLRMLAAMVASLIFTVTYGTLAAKSRRAELVLVPLLDILQSVPVLGYISFTVVFFMSLFPGQVARTEAAAIFAIFTSQAWNMTFSFYQSLRTVPRDLEEATQSFRFSAWQRFWRLEMPFAMPGLIWNMMMSMSGGWFFVVASEAITVGDKTITLPGIGAYLAQATAEKDLAAVGWVVLTMIVVIILYDQLMFRPLVAWADKFRFEQTGAQTAPGSWFLDLLQRSRLFQTATSPVSLFLGALSRWRFAPLRAGTARVRPSGLRAMDAVWVIAVAAAAAFAAWKIIDYVATGVGWGNVLNVFKLGSFTLTRVVVLIAVAALIWVPIGVEIGLRPHLAEKIQPLAQFLAAFPANLLFPVFVVASPFRPEPRHLPQPADHSRIPMVHSVQRDRRHDGVPERLPRGGDQLSHARVAMVAPGDVAGNLSLFRDRRDYCVGRRVERQHRRRGGILGQHQDLRARPRSLYRREHGLR
jgi:NitT/TauT family transport system permease protein